MYNIYFSPAEAAAVPGRDGDLHQRARPPAACRRHAAGGQPLARHLLLPHQLAEIEETVRLHHCQTFQRAGNQKFPSWGEYNCSDIKYLQFIFNVKAGLFVWADFSSYLESSSKAAELAIFRKLFADHKVLEILDFYINSFIKPPLVLIMILQSFKCTKNIIALWRKSVEAAFRKNDVKIEDHDQVYIVPGSEFGCTKFGWFRIIFAVDQCKLEIALNRIVKAFKAWMLKLPMQKINKEQGLRSIMLKLDISVPVYWLGCTWDQTPKHRVDAAVMGSWCNGQLM